MLLMKKAICLPYFRILKQSTAVLLAVSSLTVQAEPFKCATLLMGNQVATESTPDDAKELLSFIESYAQQNPERAKKYQEKFIKKVIELNNTKKLYPTLLKLVEMPQVKSMLPGNVDTVEERAGLAAQLAALIDSTLIGKGLTPESAGKAWPTWEELDVQFQNLLDKDFGPNSTNLNVRSYVFMSAIVRLTNAKFPRKNLMSSLIGGPQSFAAVNDIIKNARSEINYMTWAVYDDMTGEDLKVQLCDAVNNGKTARLIVDYLTSTRTGYKQKVSEMANCGVQVVYYNKQEVVNDTIKKYFGQHRKIVSIDGGESAVIRGMNAGDSYSHLRPGMTADEKWHDIDIKFTGTVAQDANNLFASIWNQQVEAQKDHIQFVGGTYDIAKGTLATLVDQDPTDEKPDHVFLAYLAAFRAAQERIVITNAYVILNPTLRKELKAAIERGVQVEVLSNSGTSVDEPIISRPIMESMRELALMGKKPGRKVPKVFLRKGSTLNAKVAIIDDHLVIAGSYNLHPRSLRLEGEVVALIWGGRVAKDLVRQFAIDTSSVHATEVTDPEAMVLPPDLLNGILHDKFFDQL